MTAERVQLCRLCVVVTKPEVGFRSDQESSREYSSHEHFKIDIHLNPSDRVIYNSKPMIRRCPIFSLNILAFRDSEVDKWLELLSRIFTETGIVQDPPLILPQPGPWPFACTPRSTHLVYNMLKSFYSWVPPAYLLFLRFCLS